MKDSLLYDIALTMMPKIGFIKARKIHSYFNSAERFFEASQDELLTIQGMSLIRAKEIIEDRKTALIEAEEEFNFTQKHNITITSYDDAHYPNRLRHCQDAPFVLYSKGNINFNHSKVVSVVGTRRITPYGKSMCSELIAGLKKHNPLIVSGLAYGVDISAHQAALQNDLPTVGVVGHGMDKLYPSQHQHYVNQMLNNGGVVTEFKQGTQPDRENFPKRNRIIAGAADLVIVIESAIKGGSMITANIANSYDREVFAVPGNVHAEYSMGCNALIKSHKAILLENVEDIENIMNWTTSNAAPVQTKLFEKISPEEQQLLD